MTTSRPHSSSPLTPYPWACQVSDVTEKDCWACGYCDSKMSVYMVGMMGAVFGAAIFLGLATFTAMPVSTTHAIVGGVVGVTMVGAGGSCLNWDFDGGLGGIVASWVISPVLSGIIGAGVYLLTDKVILKAASPRATATIAMPILYSSVTW